MQSFIETVMNASSPSSLGDEVHGLKISVLVLAYHGQEAKVKTTTANGTGVKRISSLSTDFTILSLSAATAILQSLELRLIYHSPPSIVGSAGEHHASACSFDLECPACAADAEPGNLVISRSSWP